MKHLIALLLLVSSLPLFSQVHIEDPSLYAGITPEMLQTTSYDSFPGAEAVYLWYEGDAKSIPSKSTIRTQYCVRLHILKTSGLEHANITRTFLHRQHDIVLTYGATHNLVDGKIETTEISHKDATVERVDDDISVFQVNFPQAKVGSIIEYRYTKLQKNVFALQWYF